MNSPIAIVADDEAPIRMLARRVLERDKWTVYEAMNGLEALRLVEEHPDASLLMTDVQMPEMSGLRLAAIVRRQRPTMKILYVTGHPDEIFSGKDALPEHEAFLEKPFSPASLTEATSLLVYGTLAGRAPDPRR